MKKEERDEKERERKWERKGRKEGRKESPQTVHAGEHMKEGGPPTARWEWQLVRPLWRTVWRLLKELKNELPCDPAALLLGTYPDRTIVPKDAWAPLFTVVQFTTAKAWNKLNAHRHRSGWRWSGTCLWWSITQPWKMKPCHLEQHGPAWRLSYWVT